MKIIQYLHEQISALAPIDGVAASANTPIQDWVVWYKEEATPEQRAQVQAFIDNFDPVAWEAQEAADAQAEETLRRSYEDDSTRKEMVERLMTATPAQIETWLTNNVTNLAQARSVLGMILKILALIVRRM